jgi:hypothetical protein
MIKKILIGIYFLTICIFVSAQWNPGPSNPIAGFFTTLSATGHVILSGVQTTGTIANSLCTDSSGNVISNSAANCFSGSGSGTVSSGTVGQLGVYTGSTTIGSTTGVTPGNNSIVFGSGSSTGYFQLLSGSGGGVTTEPNTSQASFYTWHLPPALGTSGSVLTLGSGGNTSWSSIGQNLMAVTTVAVEPQSATPVSSGLSVNVVSGGTYSYEIFAYVTSSTGYTLTLNFGTATVTSINGVITPFRNTGFTAFLPVTSYSQSITGGTYGVTITGTFVVNAAGTFVPGFATSSLATDTLQIGSWMRVIRIS